MTKIAVSRKICILALILLFYCASCCHIKKGKIYDDENRQIYFHGVNVVVAVSPYIPKTDSYDQRMSFVKEDIDKLKENGFNAIRLGIMWPGVQPKKDSYNETYLQEMRKIVDQAGEAGIYTLIQFHQWALSQAFCGVGLPTWLVHQINRYKTFPIPVQKEIYPLGQDQVPDKVFCKRHCTNSYYFAYDTAQGFEELYKKDSYVNNKFQKYWQKVAQYFKGNKYVIAYDLVNNPWVGNQYRNPALMIPGIAQRIRLQGFYDLLSQSIRRVDPQTPLCFQPTKVSSQALTGFSHPPGGSNYKDHSIYSYHYSSVKGDCIGAKVADAKRLGVPSLIAGTCACEQCLNKAQKYHQSWFHWMYKDFGRGDTTVETNFWYNLIHPQEQPTQPKLLHQQLQAKDICPKLIRTYMQRVAGDISYSEFNTKNGRFIAAYTADPDGETILYLNKQKTYNNKYSIQVSPKKLVQVKESKKPGEQNYIRIKFNGKQKEQIIINVIKLQQQQIKSSII